MVILPRFSVQCPAGSLSLVGPGERLCTSHPSDHLRANQPSILTPAAFRASSCFDFVASSSGLPAM